MNEYKQGDIVSATLNFTDTKGSKPRPALVVSNRKADNNFYESIVLAYITTTDFEDGFSLELKPEHLIKPLPRRCFLRLVKLQALEPQQIQGVITRLTPQARKTMVTRIVDLLEAE